MRALSTVIFLWSTIVVYAQETADLSKIYESPDYFPTLVDCGVFDEESYQDRLSCTTKSLDKFIERNLSYPRGAFNREIQGEVILRFIVNEMGRAIQPEIVKDIGYGCGEAALKLVPHLPTFIPARNGSDIVSMYYRLGVDFYDESFSAPKNFNREVAVLDVKKTVESMPRFPGCEDLESEAFKKKCATKKMLEFIYRNIKYPVEARENGTQGGVVISFVVKKNGILEDPKILREIGDGCGEEALRLVKAMPQPWTPGMQDGQPVNVQFNLPVKFRLP